MHSNSLPSPDDYQIEPELLIATPRRVRERPYMAAWQLGLTRGAVLLFCLMCGLASMSLRGEHDWLRRQQMVTGHVLDLKIIYGKSTSYNVGFSYSDQKGDVHADRTSVDAGAYYSLKVDDPFRVYYADDAPENWRLSPASQTSIAELQTNWYFDIGMGTVAAALGLWGFKNYRLSRIQLLRDGLATAATVTRRRVAKGSKGKTYRYLTYEWADAGGVERWKEIQVTEAMYDAYPEATRFTAIYLPNSSRSSVPYFLIKEAVVEL